MARNYLNITQSFLLTVSYQIKVGECVQIEKFLKSVGFPFHIMRFLNDKFKLALLKILSVNWFIEENKLVKYI